MERITIPDEMKPIIDSYYEDNAKRYLNIYQKRLKNELKGKHREEKVKKYNKEIEYYNKEELDRIMELFVSIHE